MTSMQYLYLDSNSLRGTIPSQLAVMTSMQYLDLGHNSLVGIIPSQLGFITNLTYLNLDHNSLTGTIPSQLGLLTSLTYLDLSYNSLTGTVPSQLGSLNLTYLNLSYNNLTGTVPELTSQPSSQPTYEIGAPTPVPTHTPTYFPTAPTPFQYVLLNKYIEQTCYGDVDQQVGYLTNTCIPDKNSSSIVSCTSQNITFQEFSTSDCFGEFNTTTIGTNNCMSGNIAGFCKETGSYYDLVLMDSGN